MFEDHGFLLWTNTFSDPAFVTLPSLGLLATECDCSIGQQRTCPILAVSLCIPVIKSVRALEAVHKQTSENRQTAKWVSTVSHLCQSPSPFIVATNLFDFISACERRGQERAWKKRRDSSLTRFPGPCCRLCSPLIGWRGCGTHSSSVSGFISGFYQHLDKQLLHRQSQITGQQRDIVQITSFKHFSS